MRSTPIAIAAFVVAAACLVTNPVVAQAAKDMITGKDIKDGTITAADVQDKSLQLKDFKPGQLMPGPAGPKGATGQAGPAGPGAFSTITMISKVIDGPLTTAGGGASVEVIPPVSVTVDGDELIMLSGSAGLGATAPQAVGLALCITDADGGDHSVAAVVHYVGTAIGSVSVSIGSQNLPAGTYLVAPCAFGLEDAPLNLDHVGRFAGWIAVASGTAVDDLHKSTDLVDSRVVGVR